MPMRRFSSRTEIGYREFLASPQYNQKMAQQFSTVDAKRLDDLDGQAPGAPLTKTLCNTRKPH